MYVTLRRYPEIGASMYEIIGRKVSEGVVPMLRNQPGFRCYCAFVSEDGDGISVTVFDDRERATLADAQVRGWVRNNLCDLVPDLPEVAAGECGIAEVAPEQGMGQPQPPFVTVREFSDLGPAKETDAVLRQHVLPVIAGSPGFRAVYMFPDECNPSQGIAVTLFDTRRNAMRSHEQSVRVFRETVGDMAPSLARTASGRAIVFASGA